MIAIDPSTAHRLRMQHLARIAAMLSLLILSGCMTVSLYHPQRAIHRPVVIERSSTNFAGMRILVRCVAHDDYLPAGDASKLCGGIARDFERQGASCEWEVSRGRHYTQPTVFDGQAPDLTIEIQSKIDHAYANPLVGCLSGCTMTMVPAVAEQTFSQHVVVLGRDRSVLTEEVFSERFVEYTGCAVWSFNWLLDWLFRSDENDISGDAGKRDFTRDFYGQIRQLAFNARMRSELLGLTERPSRASPPGEPGDQPVEPGDLPGDQGGDEKTSTPPEAGEAPEPGSEGT